MLAFLALVLPVLALSCPGDYVDGGYNISYKVYQTSLTRAQAAATCAGEGGYLADVTNAFVNSLVRSLGDSAAVQNVWIGMTCTSNQASCRWDDGTAVQYTNFASGNPDSSSGKCVYMEIGGSTFRGKWLSLDCNVQSPFICQCSQQGGAGGSCSTGYSEYDGYCYKAIAQADFTTSEQSCEIDGGHLTSIHSADENSFVLQLAQQFTTITYARIGLYENGSSITWEDGTPFDPNLYSNFGHYDPNLGNCVMMALKNDIINQGEWINNQCDKAIPAVCKKTKDGGQTVATTLGPTLTPLHCNSPQFLQGNGTLYSPGYPTNYDANSCTYVITVSSSYKAAVQFSDFSLDPLSKIDIYYDTTDQVPEITLLASNPPAKQTIYESDGTVMKLIFYSPNGAPPGTTERWALYYFGTTLRANSSSGCNAGRLDTPGTITSPNYPSPYPPNANCEYLMVAPAGRRVEIHFDFFETEATFDVLTLYDGPNGNSNIITRLSGFNPTMPQYYTSSSNYMYATFTSDANNQFGGFHASFNQL